MKKNFFIAIAIVCSLTFLSSCGPSRQVVVERPNAPYYQRPNPPGRNYIWTDGDWVYRRGGYVYQQGYWAAPRPNKHWQGGRWLKVNRGWQWQKGYWR